MVRRWIDKYTQRYPIRIGDVGPPVAAPTKEEIIRKLESDAIAKDMSTFREINKAMTESFGSGWRDVNDEAKMHSYKILLRQIVGA